MDVDSPAQQSKANAGERRMPARKKELKRITPRVHSLTKDEKINACSRARVNFKSNNPFFMIAMQPSYVYPAPHRARIPSQFARKYFKQHGNAVLCGLDGRSWSVDYSNKRFSQGWKKFAQDNHLEVGDVCIFELIKGTEYSFNVAICRAVQDGN
uniref:B3 domain-containing protein Os11g0197600-like n=1 Tax=Rhizophora mucronata TaxID=61149 RepID=A0A2P2IW58_RHIMU